MANKKTGDIEIGGRLFNTATGNIVAGADAIKDEAQGKTQAEINVETYENVAEINAALHELSPDQTEALALATDVVNLKEDVDQGAVFDVSAKYPTSGVDGGNTYTLEGALAVLNANLPANKKKGGMRIQFVHSSDNKYVQYRYTGTATTGSPNPFLNADNWQKQDIPDYIGKNVRDKKNLVILDGATADQISAYNNILFINALNVDLTGFRLITIYNDATYPRRIILANSGGTSYIFDFPENTNYQKYNVADNAYIYIGYNWANHGNNVNTTFASAKLEISQAINSNREILETVFAKDEKIMSLLRAKDDVSAIAAVKKSASISGGNYFDKERLDNYSTAGYKVTNYYIPVAEGDIVRVNNANRYTAFYNSSKELVGSVIIGGELSITVPQNAIYCRVACASGNINTFMLFINEEVPSAYYGYGDGPNIKLDFVKQDEFKNAVGEASIEMIDEIVEPTIMDGYYIEGNGSIYPVGATSLKVYQCAVSAGKTYIINGIASLYGSFPIAGFKEASGTTGNCTIILQGSSTLQSYYQPYTPANNGYIFIAAAGDTHLNVNKAKNTYQLTKDIEQLNQLNQWKGKKVVWLGTSVPFGANATKSYAQEISKHLGFELVNCSVPGLGIQLDGGDILTYGSLTATKDEYTAQGWNLPSAPLPYVPGGSYNDFYRTWENVFTQENADADLWVFDVVPNNIDFGLTDWNDFDRWNWKYYDDSSFASHRNTFIGALIYLMDKMYELNPNARMVFLLGSEFQYTDGKSAFATIMAQWNIGLIDVWSKINTSPKSLEKIRSLNGTDAHPSTFAHELMGKMLIGEFMKIA